jgi:Fis family transcriptional regulator
VIHLEYLPLSGPIRAPRHDVTELRRRIREWAQRESQEGAREPSGDLYERFVTTVERPLLEAVLNQCDGNQTSAAAILGLHRTTLRQKLRDLGLK